MPLLALLAGLVLAPADTVRLVVVATTDLHGYVTDWDYLQNASWPGGLARAATAIDSLRERYPGQVVLVDAGNALSGNPLAAYFGRTRARDQHPVIDAMNTIGYDAATPGDLDFDYGVSAFNHALAGSSFQWVSGNLKVLPEDTLDLNAYIVLQRNGVRVGITGFTTPAAMVGNGDRLRGRLRVDRIEPAVEPVLRELQQDADVSIVLMHSGLADYPSYDTTGVGGENVAARVATGRLRPDLVVLGHSGQEIVDTVIGGVHFMQPRADGRSLAVMHLALVRQGGRLIPVGFRAERIPLDDERSSPRVMRRLAEAHRLVLGWVSTVVAEADHRMPLATARVEDVPLLRFIHAVQRRVTGADLSAAPALDVRGGFDQGEITLGEVYRLYPAEHTLRSVKISGAGLRAYLEQSARYFFVDSTGRVATNRYVAPSNYDLVGGASYAIDLSQPAGSRVTRLAVRGRPVEPGDSFTLALSGARQRGEGNFRALAGAPIVYDKGENIRDLLVADLQRRRTLQSASLGAAEWSLTPAYLARRARALFVRESAGDSTAEALPATPEPVLPVLPSAAQRRTADSLEAARAREAELAAEAVATLRLPAELGQGKGLARLLADAYRNELRADIAIVLPDEAGTRLPAGGLTAAEIRAAAPGDATLLTIAMTGRDLADLFENALARPAPCCEFSGVRIQYDPKGKPWARVKAVRLAATGRQLEPKRLYSVALSSRLLSGEGFSLGTTDCRPVKGCRTPGVLSRWTVNRTTRTPADALLEYLRRRPQPVSPPEDPRLTTER
jgi:2',3'-cyclic-nucleotide 2'-phosphodiesterase/3'-nucleotidase